MNKQTRTTGNRYESVAFIDSFKPLPARERTLCMFVAHLTLHGLSHGTDAKDLLVGSLEQSSESRLG